MLWLYDDNTVVLKNFLLLKYLKLTKLCPHKLFNLGGSKDKLVIFIFFIIYFTKVWYEDAILNTLRYTLIFFLDFCLKKIFDEYLHRNHVW